jgi:general stress protein 26
MTTLVSLALLLVTSQTPAPSRDAIIAASREIIAKAHFCTFVTVDAGGQPQARVVDPLAPDANFEIWFATNPLTRKVAEIRANPKVTLSCFDASTSSYVTVIGRAALVTDPAVKKAHWKADWSPIYPKGAASADVVLVRIAPVRLEVSSEARGLKNDPKTWRPISIGFPRR